MDPFSGNTYRFRKDDQQITLYSVGINKRDDGETRQDPGKGALVVRIPVG